MAKSIETRDVFIVDGARTPFLKAKGKPGPFSASDLAVQAGRSLLMRQTFSPTEIDELIIGCVMPRENEANIGRVISLRLGCGDKVPAWTVQRNCASGLQALDTAAQRIASGRAHLILAGGTEAMSHTPLLFSKRMVDWFSKLASKKTVLSKSQSLLQLPVTALQPIIALEAGLQDPTVCLSMGQTAEILAYQFGISREDMDEFAYESHQRALDGQSNGHYSELAPLFSNHGEVFETDNGVRTDSTLERLAKLRPYFDKRYGLVTPGNSAQITDGATLLLLASEEAVKQYDLPVIGKIIDTRWAGVNPSQMGLGPVHAIVPLLQSQHLTISDIDAWEINEAFAAQVLACSKALVDADYCKQHFGLDKAFGDIPREQLNVDGGAIALGHPVGASGARLVLHILDVLKRKEAKRGVASLCIGGGQGGAMLLERI